MINSSTGRHVNGSNSLISFIRNKNGNSNIRNPSLKHMKLFVGELEEIYWLENALTNAIPTMIENAQTKEPKVSKIQGRIFLKGEC